MEEGGFVDFGCECSGVASIGGVSGARHDGGAHKVSEGDRYPQPPEMKRG